VFISLSHLEGLSRYLVAESLIAGTPGREYIYSDENFGILLISL
jgi:CubicO group peptidase (beta-lactamase class C family)